MHITHRLNVHSAAEVERIVSISVTPVQTKPRKTQIRKYFKIRKGMLSLAQGIPANQMRFLALDHLPTNQLAKNMMVTPDHYNKDATAHNQVS